MSQSQGDATSGMVLTEAQLAAVLGITEDAVIIVDRAQRIRFFNQGAEKIFGFASAEILGQPLETLLPLEARPGHHAHVAGFGDSGQVARRMGERGEIAGRRKDGSVFPAEASICRLESSQGTIFTAIVRDVTERKRQAELMRQAKEAAETATQAKSLFLANMSHEIRTPLNAVIGMTSLLLDTPMSEEQRDFAHTIRSSGEALLSIINDILDYSKIELGKLELERQPFDLRRCIEDSLDLLSPKAAEKNLNLAYIVEDGAPDTLGSDVTRLRQVLVNLVSNAVKFTPQGEVLVTVEGSPEEGGQHLLHFAVKDTGIGIPDDRLGTLFQSFSQVDASTTRKYGGTGLGLAISKRLAELMGGDMWVESQVGQGSTFHFTFRAAAAGHGERNYLHEGSPVLAGRRILIVDDNTTNRRILVKHALQWGMLPSAAASAIEALDLVRHGHAFDIAILDMAMPEMDGIGLALEIRKYRDPKALPLIMLTSMGQRQKGAAWDRASFAAHINKPIKPSLLYDALISTVVEGRAEGRPRVESQLDAGMAQRLPLSILVAEDNAVNQKVVLRILSRMGYRADVAANGVEVLDALDRQEYDLILMDVHMPELDGIEATRRIVQRFQGRSRPRIIAMTADALEGDRGKCLEAGMDGYLSKPIYIQELKAVLEGVRGGPAAAPSTLDPARLAALRELGEPGKAALLDELIALFRADAPKQLGALWRAITEGDAYALRESAHRFQSSLVNLGARHMSELCDRLEALGRDGATVGGAALMEELDREYEKVRRELETLVGPTADSQK
ncbi:MAG TPA: response regulator [Burkholderiales bacterium]